MNDLQLEPFTWCSERQLQYKPKHFVLSKTPITEESKRWIFDKLRGRFALVEYENTITAMDMGGSYDLMSALETYPAFEDPAEAVFYELTWS